MNDWVPELGRIGHVHIVAIGGAAMSALAHILLAEGHRVSGSDQSDGPVLDALRKAGAKVWIGHDRRHIEGADLVAVSTAIGPGNPELDAAIAQGIPVAGRPAMMEAIARGKRTVAVSGTHGKTTTSAMLALALDSAGFAPSFIVGGLVRQLGTGVRWNPGPWLTVEADESDGSFVRFRAESVIVTNIEEDHLDFHKSMANLEAAFDAFVDQSTGVRVVGADDEGARRLHQRHRTMISYGTDPEADFHIADYVVDGMGSRLRVERGGRLVAEVVLRVPGLHNARNAVAVLAMGVELGAPIDRLVASLGEFAGVARRFEWRGEARGITFIDDYGHLPAKVLATLRAARAVALGAGWRRIVAVFQPHRYTRTEALGADFGDVFSDADLVVVTPIYAAGQAPIPGVTSRRISDAVRTRHPGAAVVDVGDRAELVAFLAGELRAGDVCITLNAGDLTTLPDELLSLLETGRG